MFPTICFFFGLVWLFTAWMYRTKYQSLVAGATPVDEGLTANDHMYPVAEAVAMPDHHDAPPVPVGQVITAV